jgi:hypothetical protein
MFIDENVYLIEQTPNGYKIKNLNLNGFPESKKVYENKNDAIEAYQLEKVEWVLTNM